MSSLQSSIKFWLCAGGKARGRKRKGVHLDDPESSRAHRWSVPKDSSVLTIDDVILQLSDPQHHRASLSNNNNDTTILHPNHHQHDQHNVPRSAATSADESFKTETTSSSSTTSSAPSTTTAKATTAVRTGGRMTAGRLTSGYSLSLASQRSPQQSSSSASHQQQRGSQECTNASFTHQQQSPSSSSDRCPDTHGPRDFSSPSDRCPDTHGPRDFSSPSDRCPDTHGPRDFSSPSDRCPDTHGPRDFSSPSDRCPDTHGPRDFSSSRRRQRTASTNPATASSPDHGRSDVSGWRVAAEGGRTRGGVTTRGEQRRLARESNARLIRSETSGSTGVASLASRFSSPYSSRVTSSGPPPASSYSSGSSSCATAAESPSSTRTPSIARPSTESSSTSVAVGSEAPRVTPSTKTSLTVTATDGGTKVTAATSAAVHGPGSKGSAGSTRQLSSEEGDHPADYRKGRSWGERETGTEDAEDGDSSNLSKSSTVSSLCSDPDLGRADEGFRDVRPNHLQHQQQRRHCVVTKSATTSTLLTTSHRVSFDCDSSPSDSEDREKTGGSRSADGVDGEDGSGGKADGKRGGKEKKRRFGRKILPKPLRRSQSAGCAKDVPAHALFLQHNPGDKGIDTLEERLGRTVLSQGDEKESRGTGDEWGEGGTRRPPPPHARPIHKTASADAAMMARDEYGNITCQTKGKRSLAKTMKRKLLFLRRRHTDTTLGTVMKGDGKQVNKIHPDDALQWSRSFESLLLDKTGLELFRGFLRSEFSDENLEFWIAVEEFKLVKPSKIPAVAHKIYTDFVAPQAQREINLDSKTRVKTLANLNSHSKDVFEEAQRKVQALMEKDSYPRFLESDVYQRIIRSQKS